MRQRQLSWCLVRTLATSSAIVRSVRSPKGDLFLENIVRINIQDWSVLRSAVDALLLSRETPQ